RRKILPAKTRMSCLEGSHMAGRRFLKRDPLRVLAAHEAWCHAGQPWRARARIVADADLRGADLSGSQLAHVRLARVDLRGANVAGAVFSLARLEDVRLDGARLAGSQWHLAELTRVSIAGADLARANLSSGRFHHVVAAGAVLHDANLVKSCWDDCDLAQADFTGSSMIRA